MNPDLERLVRLQKAEIEHRRVEAALAEIPKAGAAADARMAAERQRLDAARAALEASLKARRQLEAAVQDLEVKRSKYKGQLMEVKTNKEYTAMLHEIEAVEKEIRGKEDLVLAEMELAEGLTLEAKREEVAFREAEQRFATETREIEAHRAALEKEGKATTAECSAAASEVPGALMELYQRVARRRGTGVAEAADGMCLGCRVRLRLQMWAEIRHNDELVQCPACSRLLYYEAPPPVTAPEP
jgi:predicted  nucleic acid-binding Zn-ribbon protein